MVGHFEVQAEVDALGQCDLFAQHLNFAFNSFCFNGEFHKIRRDDWLTVTTILRFTQCELCYHYKQSISKSTSLEQKLAALLAYRAHLAAQYADRAICWTLQELPIDSLSDCIVPQSDGMDQGKFRLPRDPALHAIASSGLVKASRPRVTVHGIWAFGFLVGSWSEHWICLFFNCKWLYWFPPEAYS